MDDSSKACGACRNMEAYWEEKKRKEQESIRDELMGVKERPEKDEDSEKAGSSEGRSSED